MLSISHNEKINCNMPLKIYVRLANFLTLCCISVTIVYLWAKISYEHRVYESVDDNSLSRAISQKPMKKRTQATKGWVY